MPLPPAAWGPWCDGRFVPGESGSGRPVFARKNCVSGWKVPERAPRGRGQPSFELSVARAGGGVNGRKPMAWGEDCPWQAARAQAQSAPTSRKAREVGHPRSSIAPTKYTSAMFSKTSWCAAPPSICSIDTRTLVCTVASWEMAPSVLLQRHCGGLQQDHRD